MVVKRFFLFILLLVIKVATVISQISTCYQYNGYWSQWERNYFINKYNIYGNYSGFIVYKEGSHPSDYVFKFTIDSYVTPDKSTIRLHKRLKQSYEYSGTAEYYVTEEYPTIDEILKLYSFPIFTSNSSSLYRNPAVKRKAKATILIKPYKKHPRSYFIFFDNVGIGIDLGDLYFKQY